MGAFLALEESTRLDVGGWLRMGWVRRGMPAALKAWPVGPLGGGWFQ